MKGSIKKIAVDYSDQPAILNKYVVSSFAFSNKLRIESGLLLGYYEPELLSDKYVSIKSLEDVISVFEQAIPKVEKTINGAVYTPKYIRDYIVKQSISSKKKWRVNLDSLYYADISCGCGAFLYTVAAYLVEKTRCSFASVLHQLYGFDISSLSIERAKIVLSLAAALNREVVEDADFRIFCRDSMTLQIKDYQDIFDNDGFDIIVGNPPYVRAKHLSGETKKTMMHWSVSKVGNADLYIPFFEVGLSLLNQDGVLGYITVNSFFKSVNARALRKYFHDNSYSLQIINFGEEKIFKGILAYTCIVFIEKKSNKKVLYCKTDSGTIKERKPLHFDSIPYKALQDYSGWHLNDAKVLDNIRIIESTGQPLASLYPVKNGIATLANDIYIFKPSREDEDYYYRMSNGREIKIEKGICRNIIKPNILKSEDDLVSAMERIIFPYTTSFELLPEQVFNTSYPYAYKFLKSEKQELLKRDKGGAKDYPSWFAFGRTQAMSDFGVRLLFPYMTDYPHFILCEDPNTLIYCGYGIFSDSIEELRCLKRILESKVFDFYIKNTSKPYSTGYYSYAKNYIKSFGVPKLSPKQKEELQRLNSQQEIDDYVCSLYGIEL